MKRIKYEDYTSHKIPFTVKFTYKFSGGFYGNPVVRIRIMKQHQHPTTFWERIVEYFAYHTFGTFDWDTLLTNKTLQEYYQERCDVYANIEVSIKNCDKQWEVF